MKTTSRTRSSSKTEEDSPPAPSPPAPSSRDSMNSNRASLTSNMDSLTINRDSVTSKRDSVTSNRDSMTSNRDSLSSNTSSTGRSQRGTPPGSFSSFTTSASLAPSLRSGASLSHTTSTSTAEKGEPLGMLKVRIVRGRNLVVRDLLSSDPYVAATLGTQSAKTKVVNRNLNPIWDEELMLSVPNPPQPLKLEVFDHDAFSADDPMGEASVDLNPLILAAQMHEGMFEEFGIEQIGRWLATSDNDLVQDSNIEVVDGLIKQDVILKLKNVDRGELDVSLEWVPPS
ncbi:hypothetical protein KC19_11G082000 [Ceratodon purpureus]|nr:hypothetical protein KC19_11G082000 [Ceratodon purpureus]